MFLRKRNDFITHFKFGNTSANSNNYSCSFAAAGVRKRAKRLGVNFSFLFMRANGEQLGQITKLIESGVIITVMDKVFLFEQANEAMSYVEAGRAKGKAVIRVRK